MLQDNPKFGKSSDVYSFGCILLELLTYELPFSNLNIYSLMKKKRNVIY
jgi:serine/threonine protein kinase